MAHRARPLFVIVSLLLALSPLHAERYLYDDPGRLIRVVYDDLSSIAYTYDPNGNITAVDVTPAGLPGDANQDGVVDQDDVDLIVQTALAGGSPYDPLTDCNGDDVIDVIDAVCAAGTSAPGPNGPAQLTATEIGAMRGDTVQVAVSLTGVAGIARALQVDLSFDPAVVILGAVVGAGALTDHVLSTSTPTPGTLRLLALSPTGAALGTGEVATISFDVDLAAPFGPSPLPLSAAAVANSDATPILPLSLDDGAVQVYTIEADVSVTKTVVPNLVSNGEAVTYTVTATNAGPSAVTGAEVTDLVPGELVSVSWSCTPTGGASCAAGGAGDIDDTVDLPVGDSVAYEVVGTVSTGAPEFDNTALASAPAEALDSTSANDQATATVRVCVGAASATIDNQDVDTVELFSAGQLLEVGPAFRVLDGGIVVLRSCGTVVLHSGVSVQEGGVLRIETGGP